MKFFSHHNRRMLSKYPYFLLLLFVVFSFGCNIVKKNDKTATLLKTENAPKEELLKEINRFAKVSSMRAKMDLKFEDNSFAEFGSKEVYRSADGEVVVQRPANILLKVQVPIIKTDVAQMSSDGTKFRVAILNDGGNGKYKRFVRGTNKADYSKLQKAVSNTMDSDKNGASSEIKQNVNAFANLRPQHFTEAILMRPIENDGVYVQSTIFQEEEDLSQKKDSPLRKVMRGYYLIDEIAKSADGILQVSRRFWFDRVGGIRLARQQIFDSNGEIESDIIYGREGNLAAKEEYNRLPLRIEVTRPKEKYKMSLTYQSPEMVSIGKTYNQEVFDLKNSWDLPEVDLDQKLQELKIEQSATKEQK